MPQAQTPGLASNVLSTRSRPSAQVKAVVRGNMSRSQSYVDRCRHIQAAVVSYHGQGACRDATRTPDGAHEDEPHKLTWENTSHAVGPNNAIVTQNSVSLCLMAYKPDIEHGPNGRRLVATSTTTVVGVSGLGEEELTREDSPRRSNEGGLAMREHEGGSRPRVTTLMQVPESGKHRPQSSHRA